MGKVTVYCSVCGDRIPNADLENGKAVMFLRKYFCRTCAVTVVKESSEGHGHYPTANPKPLKTRTQRIPLADKTKNSLIPFLIAGAIGVIALILLLYVLLSK
jgi:hypothetical protein